MRGLPPGWEWATFDAVANVDSNLVDPAAYLDFPHVAPNHIESATGRLLPHTSVRADGVTSSKHLFASGHILYSKIRPYLAKAVLVDFEGLCSADMYPVATALNPRFLHQWLISTEFTALAAGMQGRSVLPKINREGLAKLAVPVPPLLEQERIVAAIEEHLSRLDAAEMALARAARRVHPFQRSAIDNAFSALGGTEVLPAHDIFGYVTSGSRGWAKYYAEKGVPFIRVGNIPRDGIRLDLSDVQMVNPPGGAEGRRTKIQASDLLITITADIGRVAVVSADFGDGYINQHVALARPASGLNSEYLAWFIASSGGQAQLRGLQRGATKLGLGLDDIRALQIPVPSIDVQIEVASRLSTLAGEVDKALSELARQSRRAGLLRRSILAAAFAGQLVAPDPGDEPASVLLERIAAERATVTPTKRKRKVAAS